LLQFITSREFVENYPVYELIQAEGDLIDRDSFIERLLTFHSISKSFYELPVTHPSKQEFLASINSELFFAQLNKINKFISSAAFMKSFEEEKGGLEALKAIREIFFCIKLYLTFDMLPTTTQINKRNEKVGFEKNAIETLEMFLIMPERIAPMNYTPLSNEMIDTIRKNIYIEVNDLSAVNDQLETITNLELVEDSLHETPITFKTFMKNIVEDKHDILQTIRARWGLNDKARKAQAKINRSIPRASLLPNRKNVYFFLHDWRLITDDQDLIIEENVHALNLLLLAYYGQAFDRISIKIQDISEWLLP